jgi:CubicO group peptidase (beta-lactamase class C family)
MDAIDWIGLPTRRFRHLVRVPNDLASVTDRGVEDDSSEPGVPRDAADRVWRRVEKLYRTGLYPALQLCVRRRGRVVLHRSIGHASGNEPDSHSERPVPASVETPFCIYSAAKAVTAMVIHKLDELGSIRLDDRVCDYIPEFGREGKETITIRHVLGHRAGIPNLPPELMDLDQLSDVDAAIQVLCRTRPLSAPGRRLAYHAVTGGFVLGELVRRVTGRDIRQMLHDEISGPLGFRWMNYGVAPDDVDLVARSAFTGFPPFPPISTLLERAIGLDIRSVVELSNDPRFLTAIIPSANVVATADELSAFYQCLMNGGELAGVRGFDPRTIRRATREQTYLELDLTLGLPLRYGLGFMLGGKTFGIYGSDTANAFGHIGLSNVFGWADPDRELAVSLMSSGKPVLSLGLERLFRVIGEISSVYPRLDA